jgi:hypothetical protein
LKIDEIINHDHRRGSRTGIPESILAEPKRIVELKDALNASMKRNNDVLITRIQESQLNTVSKMVRENSWNIKFDAYKRTAIVFKDRIPETGDLGVVILSAGTSDRYIVEEIKLSLSYFGWKSTTYQDVGVAGIHRIKEALEEMNDESKFRIACLIVVAGQDGALFPVVAGQTELPLIAVPSPVGYGMGSGGKAALYSALQACAPGIGVVNIENGFGAAALASKILNQISK